MSPLPISASLQDYLEVILNLSYRQDTVRVTDIAESLNLTKPSVAQALKQLRKQGLIEQSPYGPVELTSQGRDCAVIIRRRHEVLKSFLVKVLNLDQETAEKDACQMEHAVSSETIERLVNFLLEGQYCSDNFDLVNMGKPDRE